MNKIMKKCHRGVAFFLAFALVFTGLVKFNVTEAKAETELAFELNVSDIDVPELGTADSSKDYTESFTQGGFTILATSGSNVTIDNQGARTYDGTRYLYRLKVNGTGSAEARSIKFTTTEAATLKVLVTSSNSTSTRTMGVATLNESTNKLTDFVTEDITGSNITECNITIPRAGTYYIHSTSGGMNFYYFSVSYGQVEDDEVREKAPDFKAGDLYVSLKGNKNAAGTFEDPMDLATAISKIPAGNTIWAFSGTYYVYDMYKSGIMIPESNSGSASAYKTISSINGKPVTFNFDGMAEEGGNRGFVLDGSYWHFYDVDICNAGDNGMLLSGDNNILELCQFYQNHDSGLQISRYNTDYATVDLWPTNNLILNCTSYNNKDEATTENADGFASKLTCGEGNVFDGCIAYCNSDDGWDLYAKPETGSIGAVTLKNCIAFGNGKLTDGVGSANGDMNGFKLGGMGIPSPHVVENCLAFYNGACGFTDNNNGGALTLKNCTSVNNGKYDTKANYTCYRTSVDAKYTNLVSYSDTIVETDTFKGALSHVLYGYKGTGYYWVNSWTCSSGDKTKYSGSEKNDYTVSSSDFVKMTVPGYSNGVYATDYHETFRNADGSVNVDGLFEIKESSKLYTAGTDGTYLGCNFTKTSENQPEKPDDPVIDTTKNGLSPAEDGNWYLYKEGVVDTTYTGFYNDAVCGWWLVEGGKVNFNYNGLYNDAACGWWLVTGGAIDFGYTGLYNDANVGWWLVMGGRLCFEHTGFYNDANVGWWLVMGGRVCFEYTGLYNDAYCGWWLVEGGAINFGYTGLYNDAYCGWWLVEGGTISFGYTGLAYDPVVGWWYVQGGAINFGYTGQVAHNGGVFNVVNGMVVF